VTGPTGSTASLAQTAQFEIQKMMRQVDKWTENAATNAATKAATKAAKSCHAISAK
jgi:hypothetical protein